MGETELRPDVTIYTDNVERDKKKIDFSLVEMCIEVKKEASQDPFDDTVNKPFEKTSDAAKLIRGQITAYVTAQLGKQFRLFAFSVVIFGPMARVIRWDRAGAVVTEAFDYVQKPGLLADFFKRFASLPPEGRGLDTSVTLLNGKRVLQGRKHSTLPAARKALGLQLDNSLFSIRVPASDSPGDSNYRTYIGGQPPCPHSLIGRSTRAWKVFDVTEERVAFLKDTWRIDADDIDPEGLTYRKLHENNVSNIPTVDASGDVGGKTMTQSLTDEPWSKVKEKVTGHIHYRLVLKEVGISLKLFRNTKQLVIVVRDCIIGKTLLTVRGFGLIIVTALGEALSKANILHRDFSVGNAIIVLDENGDFVRGLLIDWDLSKDIDKMNARRRDRTVGSSIMISFGSSYLWTGNVAIYVCGPASRRQQAAYDCRRPGVSVACANVDNVVPRPSQDDACPSH